MASVTLRRIALLVVVLALVAGACSDGSGPPATTGPLLPEDPYALPEFDLASYRSLLSELQGTPVVVNVWASWCGPCKDEAPRLAAADAEYGDRVQFLGVDILDERASARRFMHEYGWTYPSVYDLPGSIRDGLGLLGQPVTLFYDASGELVATWTGALTEEALRKNLELITA
jgi:cytochrome c biogenesis protein CcmG, thiol:disulfide interchange protein DsbE